MMTDSTASLAERLLAANDNEPPLRSMDVPVFDRGKNLVHLFAKGEWAPPRQPRKRGHPIRLENEGPTTAQRINMGVAWYASSKWRDRPAADNQNWPLGGLLKSEGANDYLALATRYRELVDSCEVELRGVSIDDTFVVDSKSTLDASTGTITYKGSRTVAGKRAKPEATPRMAVSSTELTKAKGKPVPAVWKGDLPLVHALDQRPILAHLRLKLGGLQEAFESAVLGGSTLEEIGRAHWVGNETGAKGAGRALVFLGFGVVNEAWREWEREARKKAKACQRRLK